MRSIHIDRDPMGTGEYIFDRSSFSFKSGVTILVGANGTGKTTLLKMLRDQLEKENIPYISHDNLREGAEYMTSVSLERGRTEVAATLMCSSEGEGIIICIGERAAQIGSFVRAHPDAEEMWFLFDACDSGLDIKNIRDLKTYLFNEVLKDRKGKQVYIVAAANSYEMARGERCMDARTGNYMRFGTYEEYADFIVKSAEEKNKRKRY